MYLLFGPLLGVSIALAAGRLLTPRLTYRDRLEEREFRAAPKSPPVPVGVAVASAIGTLFWGLLWLAFLVLGFTPQPMLR